MNLISFLQRLPLWLFGIVLSVFFHVDDDRLQAIMLIGFAASLAMLLLVIFALDTPFTGDMGIGPDSYQLIYDQHMR